jgi:hypothetical protein
MAVLVQIDAYDPVAHAAVTLRAASDDDAGVCGVGGQTWWPTLSKLPSLAYDLFGGDFGDNITAPTTSFDMVTEPWPDFARYQIADARVRVWTGKSGDASFALRFDGRASSQPELADGAASISITVDDSWLDAPLLATYAGTGGIEGGIDLTGSVKPLALGAPRYAAGTLIDSTNSVFQLSGYGAVQGFEAALEKLSRFLPAVADYATYDALVAATVPAGAWATSRATGLARFGAPPAGQISFLLQGDAAGPDGWARLPGQIIRRVAQIAGGLAKVSDASLNALDAARPWALSNVIVQQTTAREVIQSIAASVNAVAGISWLGQLFVVPVAIGTPSVTLDATGAALPPVASVSQAACDAPWWRLAIGAVRCWTVHALSDIAFDAALTPRGAYSDATVYREGDIVTVADGSRWLYTATTPSSGHAPPNLTYWQPFSADVQVALDRIKVIESDSVLSAGEKPQTILFWTQADRERPALEAQASSRGVNYAAYEGAYQSLATYLGSLSPAWSDTTQDTPIDPATFNQRWSDYYQQRTLLLNAVTADVGAAANEAAAEASAAIAQIGVIASDNWLSRGEKPAAIADWTAIDQENGILNAEAQTFNYDGNNPGLNAGSAAIRAVNDARYALAVYLGQLSPHWDDTTVDTPIDGPTFRAKFATYYSAKATLLSAFAVSASRIASWDGVYGTGKDQLVAQAAAAASDAQGALRQLGIVASDGYLSRGEKPQVIADWQAINSEGPALNNQAVALGYDGGQPGVSPGNQAIASYNAVRLALDAYLGSLSPAWNDTTQDTAINPATFRGKFTDYYYAKVVLENAMAQTAANAAVGTNSVILSSFSQGLRGFAPAAAVSNWYPVARADVAGDLSNRCYVDLALDTITGAYAGKRHVVQVHLTQFSNTGNSVMASNIYIDVFHTVSPWGGVGPGTAFAQARQYMMGVKPGERVFARCLGAEHRCSLLLYALFFDSSGGLVEAVCWGTDRSGYVYTQPTFVTPARDGGGQNGDPANFNIMGGYYDVANPNSAYMSLMWRVAGTGGNDPYVFFGEPAMGKLSKGQVLLPPYVDGPSSPPDADNTKTAWNSLTGVNPEDTNAQANAAR